MPLKRVPKGDIAESLARARKAIRKLLHTGKNLSEHLRTTARKCQVITESHPACQEMMAWERQFNAAMIEAEKSLVN